MCEQFTERDCKVEPKITVIKDHKGFQIQLPKATFSFDDGESVEGLVTVFEILGFKANYEEVL
jgi:hypothetical protein